MRQTINSKSANHLVCQVLENNPAGKGKEIGSSEVRLVIKGPPGEQAAVSHGDTREEHCRWNQGEDHEAGERARGAGGEAVGAKGDPGIR